MSEAICTCHCGGSMFYRHLHAESCVLSREGEEAPKSELQALRDERDRLRRLIEPLLKMTPERPNAITWENGVQIINYVQDILKAALTPGEGGQDE